jgi:hypothetical protein
MNQRKSFCLSLAVALYAVLLVPRATAQVTVSTYHNDNYRTGWNNQETQLTPGNVGSSSFGLLHTVALDDQVDAQPLVVPGVNISGQGTHDVVYVATESNTIYAIDANSGAVLLSQNFGPPVPYTSLPGACNNNGPNVGINSTPVIDTSSGTMYVITYTLAGSQTYDIHALSLSSLTDQVPPVVISASHKLANGKQFLFNASVQRQRPGLLLANGNVYAGFGSFCDINANQSRGWLLGWAAGTLTPLSTNLLTDRETSSPDAFFLSSIWMSGYGIAADPNGDLFFVTGNSDYSGTSYNRATNIAESVVKVNPALSRLNYFTPSDEISLDQSDADFGSGGILLLPQQPGPIPNLAVAAGKDGNMYLMNQERLGGYSPNVNHVVGTYGIGGCWCGQSYYVDPSDNTARVVSSGGNAIGVWKVQTHPHVALVGVSSAGINSGQDPGFFTSISSNGTSDPIIWAVGRPFNKTHNVTLYAFDPEQGGSSLTQIYSGTAGNWPNLGGNANLVPVVANGHVFVASYRTLDIFGLVGTSKSSGGPSSEAFNR